eukprot:m.131035 g.131035  ORF g.131035 m.131035 type:complete len:4598 (-) comp14790_c0_seq1:87-13880(-)
MAEALRGLLALALLCVFAQTASAVESCASLPSCTSCTSTATGVACLSCAAPTYLFLGVCQQNCSMFPGYRETIGPDGSRTCSPCPAGFFDATPAGAQTCTRARTCNNASQYVATASTAISDTVCGNLSSLCSSNEYIARVPSSGASLLCLPLRTCVTPYYEYQAPTLTTNRLCVRNSTTACGAGLYQLANVTGSTGTTFICADLTICSASEYETRAATTTSDRRCTTLTSCITSCPFALSVQGLCSCPEHCFSCLVNTTLSYCQICQDDTYLYQGVCLPNCDSIPGATGDGTDSIGRTCVVQNPLLLASPPALQYQSSPPSATTDRRCSLVTSCVANQWQAAAATAVSNTLCFNWSVCSPTQFESVAPTSLTNRVCANIRNCTVNEFETTRPTSTSNRICGALTVCRPTLEFQTVAPTLTSDRSCANLTRCNATQFESVAPTTTSNRVCTDLTRCAQWQFISTPATATSDLRCTNATLCAFNYQYVFTAPTLTSDRVCRNISSCPPTHFVAAPATETTDTVCQPIRACRAACTNGALLPSGAACSCSPNCAACQWTTALEPGPASGPASSNNCQACISSSGTGLSNGTCVTLCSNTTTTAPCVDPASTTLLSSPTAEFQLAAPTLTSDRVCQALRVCGADSFESTFPTVTSDRVCTALTQCKPNEYITRNETSTSDRRCDPITPCGPTEYTVVNATIFSNPRCAQCSVCPSSQFFISGPCTRASNTVCSLCAQCDFNYSYVAAACSVTSDTVCRNCTTCQPGQWQQRACLTTADTVCRNCSVCPAGFFQSTACSSNSDTVCTPVRSCAATEFISTPATYTSDARCSIATVCNSRQYALQPLTLTSDRVCRNLTSPCVLGATFEARAPTASSDRVCTNCTSLCPLGSFLTAACSATADTVCEVVSNCGDRCRFDPTAQYCNVNQLTAVTPCRVFADAASCPTSRCQWRSGEGVPCVPLTVTALARAAFAQLSCEILGEEFCSGPCVWDRGQARCRPYTCPDYTDAGRCVTAGCVYNATLNYCVAPNTLVPCRMHYTPALCALSSDRCWFDTLTSTCYDSGTQPPCTAYSGLRPADCPSARCRYDVAGRYCTAATVNTPCSRFASASSCPVAGAEYQGLAPTPSSDAVCLPSTVCTSSQFIIANVTLTTDRACRTVSSCTGTTFLTQPATPLTDTQCTNWSPCRDYEYESVAPTNVTNRVCSNISTCNANFYQSVAPTTTSDRICQPVLNCSQGSYIVTPATTTSNTVCREATACQSYQYTQAEYTATSDRRCVNNTVCGSNAFETRAPTYTSDRRCQPLTVCNASFFEFRAPTPTTDRVCQAVTRCSFSPLALSGDLSIFTFQAVPPTPTSDAVCMPIRGCSRAEYQASPPTATSDTVCAPITSCPFGEVSAVSPTATSNRVCRQCDAGFVNTGPGEDVCNPCTSSCGGSPSYLAGTCTPTTDRVCTPCSTCPSGSFTLSACSLLGNTVCQTCTNASDCGVSQYLAGTCDPTKLTGPSCQPCHPSCYTCAGPAATQCLSCSDPLVLQTDGSCSSACPAGQYPDATRACQPCSSTCGALCAGPSANECITCKVNSTGQPTSFLLNATCVNSCRAVSAFLYANLDQGVCSTCRTCNPGQFISQPCSEFSTTMCESCKPGATYQNDTNQASCLNATICAPGTFSSSSPTLTSDRVCTACPLDTFQPLPAQPSCNPTRVCTNSEYQSQSPTPTSDRVCKPQTFCNFASQYISVNVTATSDRVCSPITMCNDTQYVFAWETTTTDRVCANLTVCTGNTVEAIAPRVDADRVCSPPLTFTIALRFVGLSTDNLTGDVHFSIRAALTTQLSSSLQLNASAGWISFVSSQQGLQIVPSVILYYNVTVPQLRAQEAFAAVYNLPAVLSLLQQLAPPLSVFDPVYNNMQLVSVACGVTEYLFTTPAPFPVPYCRPNTVCVTGSQYEFAVPTLTTDRVCRNVTACTATQFIERFFTSTSDTVCRALTVCSASEFESLAATTTTNRQCLPFAVNATAATFTFTSSGGFTQGAPSLATRAAQQSYALFSGTAPGSTVTLSASVGSVTATAQTTLNSRLAVSVSAVPLSPATLLVDSATFRVLFQVTDVSGNQQTQQVSVQIVAQQQQPTSTQTASCVTTVGTGQCIASLTIPSNWFSDAADQTINVLAGFSSDPAPQLLQTVLLKARISSTSLLAATSGIADVVSLFPQRTLALGESFTVGVWATPGASTQPLNSFQLRFRSSPEIMIASISSPDQVWTSASFISQTGRVAAITATAADLDALLDAVPQARLLCEVTLTVTNNSNVVSSSSSVSLTTDVLSFFDTANQVLRATPFEATSVDATGTRRGSGALSLSLEKNVALVPRLSQAELINTAVLTGTTQTFPLAVDVATSYGRVVALDAGAASCVSAQPTVVQVDPRCRFLFLDGTETSSGSAVTITISHPSLPSVTFTTRVWYPRSPVSVLPARPTLNRIRGLNDSTLQCAERFAISDVSIAVTFAVGSSTSTVRFNSRTVPLSSTNPDVIAITPTGILFARAAGTASIFVTRLGASAGSATVTAVDTPLSVQRIWINVVSAVNLSAARTASLTQVLTAQATWSGLLTAKNATGEVQVTVQLSDGSLLPIPTLLLSSVNLALVSTNPLVATVTSAGVVRAVDSGQGFLLQGTLRSDPACGASFVAVDYGFVSVQLPPPSRVRVALSATRVLAAGSQYAPLGILQPTATVSISLEYVDRVEDLTLDPRLILSPDNASLLSLTPGANGTLLLAPLVPLRTADVTVSVSFVHVNVTATFTLSIVDGIAFSLLASPFPTTPSGPNSTSTLARIGTTNEWERFSVSGLVTLTSGPPASLSYATLTNALSFTSNPSVVSLVPLPSQRQLVGRITGGYVGPLSLTATLSTNTQVVSTPLFLTVSPVSVTPVSFINLAFPATFTGAVGSTSMLTFDTVLDDSTVIPYSFFSLPPTVSFPLSALVNFSSSNPAAVSVSPLGTAVLLGNSYQQETLTIFSQSSATTAQSAFYCNLLPVFGDCDLGAQTGAPVPPQQLQTSVTIPLTINLSSSVLRSMELTVVFDSSLLSLSSVTPGRDWPGGPFTFNLVGGTVTIGGTCNNPVSGSAQLALLTFRTISNGLARVTGQVDSLDDVNGDAIGSLGPFVAGDITFPIRSTVRRDVVVEHTLDADTQVFTPPRRVARRDAVCANAACSACIPARPEGDTDGNCVFNLLDILYLSTWLNQLAVTTTPPPEVYIGQWAALDADRSGVVNSQDANYLLRAFQGRIVFLRSYTGTPPGTSPACALSLTASFATATGAAVTDLDVYFWIQATQSTSNFLSSSAILQGSLYSTTSGVLIQGASLGNGQYSVSLVTSQSNPTLGVSLLTFTAAPGTPYTLARSWFYVGTSTNSTAVSTEPLVAFVASATPPPVQLSLSSPWLFAIDGTVSSLECQARVRCQSEQYLTAPATMLAPPQCKNATVCSVVEYEIANLTATTDRKCQACVPCNSSFYATRACSATSDTVCQPLSTCSTTTEYQLTAPTASSNRVCAPCSTCSFGTFRASGCDGLVNSQCQPWKNCSESEYQITAGTPTSDRRCAVATPCGDGRTFEVVAATATSNRVCAECTNCSDTDYQTAACALTQNTQCARCDTCRTGLEWRETACTAVANTQCRSCGQCEAGVTYQAAACSANANTVCSPCAQCGSNQYTLSSCTLLQNRICVNYSTCDASRNQFEVIAPTPFADRVCDTLTTCTLQEYEFTAPTATSNRVCRPYTNCTAQQYQVLAATRTSDRSCAFLTTCNSWEYQNASATLTSNRVCLPLTNCSAIEFQAVVATPTSDRLCQLLTQCNRTWQYETKPATLTNDRICQALRTCNLATQFQSVAPTLTSDRECTSLTPCDNATQFEAAAGTSTSNRQCASLAVCQSFQYELSARTATSNRVCVNASTCVSGQQYLVTEKTTTTDRVCRNYTTCRTGLSASMRTLCSDCGLAIGGTLPVTPLCSSRLITACATDSSPNYCAICTASPPNLNNLNDPCMRFAVEWATATCNFPAQDYQVRAPTATSDRNCTPVTVCNSSQYELVAPTAFSDRICTMRTVAEVPTSASSSSSSGDPWWLYVAIAGGGLLVIMVVLYIACRPRRRQGSAEIRPLSPRAGTPMSGANVPLGTSRQSTPRAKAFELTSSPATRSLPPNFSDSNFSPVSESSFVAPMPARVAAAAAAPHHVHHPHAHAHAHAAPVHAQAAHAAAPQSWSIDDNDEQPFMLSTNSIAASRAEPLPAYDQWTVDVDQVDVDVPDTIHLTGGRAAAVAASPAPAAAAAAVTLSPQASSPGKQSIAYDLMLETLQEARSRSETIFAKFGNGRLTGASFTAGMNPINKPKNRYANILPNDASRVRLREVGPAEGADYINANHISYAVGSTPRTYIAAQAPLPHTTAEFWQMAWENQARIVVMLTTFTGEDNQAKFKCARYVPEHLAESRTFGHFRVTLNARHAFAGFTEHVLTLTHTQTNTPRRVHHLQFDGWPDMGVPRDTVSSLLLIEKIFELEAADPLAPLLVHCTAGVGRTGALILEHIMIHQIRARETPHADGILTSLRQQRAGMVQRPEQFAFAQDVVLAWLRQRIRDEETVL